MPRHVGIRPESVTTFRRQLNLYGRQMQAIPGYELNQSWHVPCKSDWKTNIPRHVGLSPGSVRHVACRSGCKTNMPKHAGVRPESIKRFRLQFKLDNKHAKTCQGTSWISHDLPRAFQAGTPTCQDMSEIHLNQSGHVACSTCSTINMQKYFGILPESVKTVPRQLKLGGKQVQGMPGHELNQS